MLVISSSAVFSLSDGVCKTVIWPVAKAEDFCYAEGDEGAEYCGDPKSRHCSVLGDAAFWRSEEGQAHLVKCDWGGCGCGTTKRWIVVQHRIARSEGSESEPGEQL